MNEGDIVRQIAEVGPQPDAPVRLYPRGLRFVSQGRNGMIARSDYADGPTFRVQWEDGPEELILYNDPRMDDVELADQRRIMQGGNDVVDRKSQLLDRVW